MLMPRLTPDDWRKLRNRYGVAFRGWSKGAFEFLLQTVYRGERKSGKFDHIDAMMILISGDKARTEPPIPPGPWPGPKKTKGV